MGSIRDTDNTQFGRALTKYGNVQGNKKIDVIAKLQDSNVRTLIQTEDETTLNFTFYTRNRLLTPLTYMMLFGGLINDFSNQLPINKFLPNVMEFDVETNLHPPVVCASIATTTPEHDHKFRELCATFAGMSRYWMVLPHGRFSVLEHALIARNTVMLDILWAFKDDICDDLQWKSAANVFFEYLPWTRYANETFVYPYGMYLCDITNENVMRKMFWDFVTKSFYIFSFHHELSLGNLIEYVRQNPTYESVVTLCCIMTIEKPTNMPDNIFKQQETHTSSFGQFIIELMTIDSLSEYLKLVHPNPESPIARIVNARNAISDAVNVALRNVNLSNDPNLFIKLLNRIHFSGLEVLHVNLVNVFKALIGAPSDPKNIIQMSRIMIKHVEWNDIGSYMDVHLVNDEITKALASILPFDVEGVERKEYLCYVDESPEYAMLQILDVKEKTVNSDDFYNFVLENINNVARLFDYPTDANMVPFFFLLIKDEQFGSELFKLVAARKHRFQTYISGCPLFQHALKQGSALWKYMLRNSDVSHQSLILILRKMLFDNKIASLDQEVVALVFNVVVQLEKKCWKGVEQVKDAWINALIRARHYFDVADGSYIRCVPSTINSRNTLISQILFSDSLLRDATKIQTCLTTIQDCVSLINRRNPEHCNVNFYVSCDGDGVASLEKYTGGTRLLNVEHAWQKKMLQIIDHVDKTNLNVGMKSLSYVLLTMSKYLPFITLSEDDGDKPINLILVACQFMAFASAINPKMHILYKTNKGGAFTKRYTYIYLEKTFFMETYDTFSV